MKRIILPIALLLTLQTAIPAQAGEPGIPFLRASVDEGKNMAAQKNKLLLVHFTASWCMPCQWMNENTFRNYQVSNYVAEYFIPVRLDVDEFIGFKEKEAYGITRLPTFLVFNASGELVARIEKSLPANEFLNLLREVNTAFNRVYSDAPEPTLSAGIDHLNKPGLVPEPIPGESIANSTSRPSVRRIYPSSPNEEPERPAYQPIDDASLPAGNRTQYGVQVALFSHYKNAIPYVTRLEAKLSDPVDIFVNNDYNKTIYKVVIGKCANEREAKVLQKKLERWGYEGEVKDLSSL